MPKSPSLAGEYLNEMGSPEGISSIPRLQAWGSGEKDRRPMAKLAFRFRIYPSPAQKTVLLRHIETCRHLWNDALGQRKERYEKHGQSTSYYDQQNELPQIKKDNKFVAELYSHVAQDVLRRLDKAFMAFFQKTARRPKFKAYREYGSFTYPDAYNGSVKLGASGRKLYLSKVGYVPVVAHRDVPADGLLKTCTVKREADGKWYAVLLYETKDALPPVPAGFSSPVGIDLGLTPIVATSDGEKVEPERFYRKAEKRLARLQKSLSRKRKGSANRAKARRKVAVQAVHVARQREDFNHKISARLVAEHDFIAVGNLEVGKLQRRRTLSKSFHDAGLGQLVQFIKYKAERNGRKFVLVPEPYTTQDCNDCGKRNSVGEGVMQFVCVGCGHSIDRQVNAARNILDRGCSMVGQDIARTYKPVETGALLAERILQATSVWEAGTSNLLRGT